LKHANQIRALDELRIEITAALPLIDLMIKEAHGDLALLGPIAQLNHALNDSLGSIVYLAKLLKSDAQRPASKRNRST
jgi:hypothetical protein